MSDKILSLRGISKSYEQQSVIAHLDLDIASHSFVTLLGPSGCGKTTILRIIGGFETPDTGHVLFHGKDITNLPPYERNINTVFQKYALFPHLNVADNIAFGLKIKKMSKAEIAKKVDWALELVNLPGFQNRRTNVMSGGQQQRIAIARAIVNEPKILLLDEPLGALDLKLRKEMQYELKKLQQDLGITFIYVTHDQEEALTMSDTVVVMNDGIIQQIGEPEDIYNEPANAFIADFIGESNIIPAIMLEDELVKILDHTVKCVDKGFARQELVDVVIRPEDLKITELGKGFVDGVVSDVIFKGVHYEISVETGNYEWLIHTTRYVELGTEVGLTVTPFNIHIMKKVVDL